MTESEGEDMLVSAVSGHGIIVPFFKFINLDHRSTSAV